MDADVDMDFLIFLDVDLLLLLLLLLLRSVNRLLPPLDGTDGADAGNSISAYTGKWSEKRIPPFEAYSILVLSYVQYFVIFNLFE